MSLMELIEIANTIMLHFSMSEHKQVLLDTGGSQFICSEVFQMNANCFLLQTIALPNKTFSF